jgi:Ca2+:H+ antiporter
MPRWFYYLLVLAVVAPILALVGGSQQETAIFVFSALSLIPLAAIIGRATEDLAYYVGPIAGGLLNATFGNAPELIIGIFALRSGLILVVKASITGSVISNALLVLGGSLALGGWRFGRQYFSNRDAGQYSAMLLMAVAGFLIPFIGSLSIKDTTRLQSISTGISIILLLVYLCYLALHIFGLRSRRRNPTHHVRKMIAPMLHMRKDDDDDDDDEEEQNESEQRTRVATGGLAIHAQEQEQGRRPHLWLTVLMLLITTLATAWNSELLVGAIEPVAQNLGWSPIFIGLVIIPIVGNAAEHSSALLVAYKDRIDLSLAIAAGSSIQVATFVAPLLVLISLFMGPISTSSSRHSNWSCSASQPSSSPSSASTENQPGWPAYSSSPSTSWPASSSSSCPANQFSTLSSINHENS